MKNITLLFLFVIIVLTVFSCNSEEVVTPQIQQNLLGVWELHNQTGSQANVCDGQLGELVEFTASGVAYFQCPASEVQSVNYTAIDTIITFTDTGVQYGYHLPNDTNLVLTGINLDIVLTYSSNIIYN